MQNPQVHSGRPDAYTIKLQRGKQKLRLHAAVPKETYAWTFSNVDVWCMQNTYTPALMQTQLSPRLRRRRWLPEIIQDDPEELSVPVEEDPALPVSGDVVPP